MSKQEYKVVDIIDINHRWASRFFVFIEQGEGILVILYPKQISSVSDINGKIATIKKANGEIFDCSIRHSEVHDGVVGIFFKDVKKEDIPHGSTIMWE